MSKPVSFTCQHFPDYSLLLSFFLLVAFFGSERRALLNFPFFFLFAQGGEGSFRFSFFFAFFSDQICFIREVRVLVNFSLFFSFSFFFLIRYFCPGRSGFLLRSQAREQLERDGTLPSQWNRSPSNQCKWN